MAKPRILVVEDDSIIVMELENRLDDLGYGVCATTAYGEEAIQKAAELRPDLVLMDIRLKGTMDGVEAAAQIRAQYDIPVIYLTAYADNQTLQRARLTEPYSYIIKPFEERELYIAIEMALYKHKMDRERRALQEQLFQAQKMEAVQALVAGMVHDFNNSMTTIIAHSSFILSHLGQQDPLRKRLEYIKKAGEQATALAQQALAASQGQELEANPVDLNAVAGDMLEVIRRLAGEGTEVIGELEPGLGRVKADRGQIEQAVMNLAVNAHEAMPEGGTLTIRTEAVALDQERCKDIPGAYPGTFICLSVADTGVGLDEETRRHVFEPFFSTKQKGMGLGLTIAGSIVRQWDGWLDVQSAPGQGSTFRIYLPAMAGAVDRFQDDGGPLQVRGKGERILLVEDNEGVRSAVAEMLQAGGYVIFEAASATEALDVYDKEGGKFDLVFSDVVLPDQDGIRLVDQLLSREPGLAILMSSGYLDERAQLPLIRARGFHFLQKPFGFEELMPTIERAMRKGSKKG
jgi:two-component system cell cycle sensor histidine kinase/response regulator CckA